MTARVLEVVVGGTPQGRIHLNLVDGLRVTRLRMNEGFMEKFRYHNLLNKNTDYSSFGYELYKETLEKGIKKSFPWWKSVRVNELDFGKFEKLYEKFARKQSKYINNLQR